MTEYILLVSDYSTDLSAKVENRLKYGWQLYGSPFFANGCYCQAMVK